MPTSSHVHPLDCHEATRYDFLGYCQHEDLIAQGCDEGPGEEW